MDILYNNATRALERSNNNNNNNIRVFEDSTKRLKTYSEALLSIRT